MQHILQHLFKKSSLAEVPLTELKELAKQHPYFATAHLLLAQKLKLEKKEGFEQQLQKTALYFNNPLWLNYLMEDKKPSAIGVATKTITTEPIIEKEKLSETTDELFDPYHTIDYFASLGIKLSQEVKADDKLGNQLKSFTEWLKTMRRLPAATLSEEEGPENDNSEQNAFIEKIAAHSLEEKEILTEAMAEVLLLQGKKEKAASVYHKLSLLNPDKRAYFAAKIDELK